MITTDNMVAIIEKRNFRDFDWLVAVLAIAIVCFGVWQIYNAAADRKLLAKANCRFGHRARRVAGRRFYAIIAGLLMPRRFFTSAV